MIINEILTDLINEGKVTTFVNNVLVCQAKKVCIRNKEDWVPRDCHKAQWNRKRR